MVGGEVGGRVYEANVVVEDHDGEIGCGQGF